MWSVWTLTPRYRSISEHFYPVHPSFHAHRVSSSNFRAVRHGTGCVVGELTTCHPCLERRAEFSLHQVTRTRLRSTCGSKHLVRLHSIFCCPTEPIFASRLHLVLFWYLDLITPTLRPPLGKTPQKPRPCEDTCDRWFGPSRFPALVVQPRQPTYQTPQHALVWWKTNAVPDLARLDPRHNLNSQLPSQCFSIPNVPVAQDTSAHTHALAIEAALGGPDHMAARVGTCAQSSLIAAQLLRVREAWPDVWARTVRVQVASAFLCSMMCGSWVGMNEPEACATGMWVHGTSSSPGHWDEGVLEIIGGNREEGRRIRAWLGDVDLSGSSRKVGMVSRYLVDRYRFDHGEWFPCTSARVFSNPVFQIRSSRPSPWIRSLRTFLSFRNLQMLSYNWDRWITLWHLQPTMFPPAFSTYIHTPLKTQTRSANTSLR